MLGKKSLVSEFYDEIVSTITPLYMYMYSVQSCKMPYSGKLTYVQQTPNVFYLLWLDEIWRGFFIS